MAASCWDIHSSSCQRWLRRGCATLCQRSEPPAERGTIMMPLIDAFICTPLHLYNLSAWRWEPFVSTATWFVIRFFVCVFFRSLMRGAQCAKSHSEEKLTVTCAASPCLVWWGRFCARCLTSCRRLRRGETLNAAVRYRERRGGKSKTCRLIYRLFTPRYPVLMVNTARLERRAWMLLKFCQWRSGMGFVPPTVLQVPWRINKENTATRRFYSVIQFIITTFSLSISFVITRLKVF